MISSETADKKAVGEFTEAVTMTAAQIEKWLATDESKKSRRLHLAQKPDGGISETNWRYSLMNRGHDPAK